MIRSLKLFAACVESMRTAEKAYEDNPTPFNKGVLTDLKNKVDAWVQWINTRQDVELVRKVPPFVGKTPSTGYQGIVNNDIMQQLVETHTPEEIEKFTQMLRF